MKKRLQFLSIVLLMAAFGVTPAMAQDGVPPTADEVNAIAKNMFCPVCENIPLDVCGTTACAQWRQQIADMLQEGKTEQEIYDFFAESYGDRVLAEPPKHGLNWLVYILPPVALVILGFGFFNYINTRRKPLSEFMDNESSDSEQNAQDEYESRLEEELKKRF